MGKFSGNLEYTLRLTTSHFTLDPPPRTFKGGLHEPIGQEAIEVIADMEPRTFKRGLHEPIVGERFIGVSAADDGADQWQISRAMRRMPLVGLKWFAIAFRGSVT
jgi:hypothetical protein